VAGGVPHPDGTPGRRRLRVGLLRPGLARLGLARPGLLRPGLARRGDLVRAHGAPDGGVVPNWY